MESSSKKIILVHYKLSPRDFRTIYNSISNLNYFVNDQKIIRFCISSSRDDSLIIEVILKDH